jgi:hypothetical protein
MLEVGKCGQQLRIGSRRAAAADESSGDQRCCSRATDCDNCQCHPEKVRLALSGAAFVPQSHCWSEAVLVPMCHSFLTDVENPLLMSKPMPNAENPADHVCAVVPSCQ